MLHQQAQTTANTSRNASSPPLLESPIIIIISYTPHYTQDPSACHVGLTINASTPSRHPLSLTCRSFTTVSYHLIRFATAPARPFFFASHSFASLTSLETGRSDSLRPCIWLSRDQICPRLPPPHFRHGDTTVRSCRPYKCLCESRRRRTAWQHHPPLSLQHRRCRNHRGRYTTHPFRTAQLHGWPCHRHERSCRRTGTSALAPVVHRNLTVWKPAEMVAGTAFAATRRNTRSGWGIERGWECRGPEQPSDNSSQPNSCPSNGACLLPADELTATASAAGPATDFFSRPELDVF